MKTAGVNWPVSLLPIKNPVSYPEDENLVLSIKVRSKSPVFHRRKTALPLSGHVFFSDLYDRNVNVVYSERGNQWIQKSDLAEMHILHTYMYFESA